MEEGGDPPVVALPERLDRKLRFGPFASGRDALKFVSYVAAGALLVPFLGEGAWIPFVLAGLAVTLWRPDGDAIDERLVRFARWKVRGAGPGGSVKPSRPGRTGRRSTARLPGAFVGILRTGGLPLAYLPPAELRRRFESYRDLLRAFDGTFVLLVTRAPIHPVPFLPAEPTPPGPEGAARAGYLELMEVIVRRRHLRQVYLALATSEPGASGVQRLETQIAAMVERLRALGLRPVRLRDRALGEALHRMGIAGETGER